MIWTEIKNSINSNLRVPLDKLLTNDKYGLEAIMKEITKSSKKTYTLASSIDTSLANFTKVFEISGKGALVNSALCEKSGGMYSSGTTIELKIVIDSETIFDAEVVLDGAHSIGIEFGCRQVGSTLASVFSSINYGNSNNYFNISPNKQSKICSNNSEGIFCNQYEPVTFNEKLEIYAKQTLKSLSQATKITTLYQLEE